MECIQPTAMSTTMENRRPDVLPHNIHYHQAVIMKRNKVLAIGHNGVGSRSKGCGYSRQTIHAERAVVKNLGDTSLLRGATLIVYRYNAHDKLLNSKPCDECQIFLEKCMKQYGLSKVIYSVEA
uniref:CMP/dCMP-type deaminase domain-containing protein n=1 Tax=viral metagenome TaxID=1070528 RepID=A0A6C0F9E7_9ZZZZ